MGTRPRSLLPEHPTPIPRPGGDRLRGRGGGRRVGHKEETGRGADGEAAAAGAGPPSRGSEGEGEPSPPRLPCLETQLQLSSKRRTPPGPREIPKLCPPSRRQPATPLAPTAAPAHPPQRSARVYLRPRSRRWLRRRPHCRSRGPRHAAAKFPNMDSFVRFEMCRGPPGRRFCRPGREAAAVKGADPSCAAPRGLRHRCSPSPRLVWPPPSPRVSSPPPSLRSAQPRRHQSTRYGDAGSGCTRRALLTRLLWLPLHRCRATWHRRAALANRRLRQRNVAGGVTSRGL